jgi:hypothetical protein
LSLGHELRGWQIRDQASFSDGTSHVLRHWRTDLAAPAEAGIRPHIYVTQLDDVLRKAAGQGAEVVTLPYQEGNLTIATVRDPAGNVIGIWQEGTI